MVANSYDIPELDRKGLRHFAFTSGGIVAVLFGLLFPWLLEISFPTWPWVIAGVLSLWGLAAPASLRPAYHYWMRFGLLLSRITTPLVLGLVFYLMFVPIAFVMRLTGRDPMARKLEKAAKSYRIPSRAPSKEHMEKPF